MSRTYRLVEADSTALFAVARGLIEEYAAQMGASMGVDLTFQSFAAELGRHLADRLVAKPRALGYRRMGLDTLGGLVAPQTPHRSAGFRETEPYYFNPIAGGAYMEL